MLRVALTGCASTGKTTILNDLRPVVADFATKKGLNIVFQEERVRTIFREEFSHQYPTFEDLMEADPLSFQLRASEAVIQDAFSHQDKDTLVLSDRMGLDILVYTTINIARGFHDPQIEAQITANLKKAMLRVDKAFMTRPLPTVVMDGFRPKCYTGRFRVLEENLFDVLGSTHPNTVWLPSGREERIDLIMTTIRGVYE